MANSNFLEDFKSKVTYETKTTYGAVLIVLGFIAWGITHEYIGLFTIILVMIPSIMLIIPNESIKNSKILGIILAIVILFVILTCVLNIMGAGDGYYYYYYDDYSPGILVFYNLVLLVYSFLNLISCYMLSIKTEKIETGSVNNISDVNKSSKVNFCKYCGAKLDNDSKFCPSCGKEL